VPGFTQNASSTSANSSPAATAQPKPSKPILDIEVVQDGIRVLIDSKAQLSLLGSEVDFVESELGSEFVFRNPNVKGVCGCGESFSI
jgi:iron-sulfur cluster assembly accessory protein